MYTFNKMWGVVTPEEAAAKIEEQRKEITGEPKNLEEQAISLVGRDIYEKLIKGYTEKQWGRDCKDIHPLITPHPEERIWAGRTPRAPDAPKIKHNGMKRFYMVDMGVKNVILSFYQKKCESLSLAKEKSLSQ